MNRSVWGVVLSGLLVGCGPSGVEPSEPESAAARHDAVSGEELFTTVISPIPALPELVDLDRAPLRRFYPEDAASAFTAFYRDAKDPRRFYAIGFDVKAAKAYFYVTGTTDTALDLLRKGVLEEAATLAPSTGAAGTSCSIGYVGGPGPKGPGPGIFDRPCTPSAAWRLASVVYAAGR
jgi:hypothetical protein